MGKNIPLVEHNYVCRYITIKPEVDYEFYKKVS